MPAHILSIALVMFAFLVSTLANSGSVERYLVVWGGFFAVALLVEATFRERPLQLLLALKIVLGTLAVVNCATVLAQPEGLWSSPIEGYWLLGHRNNFGTPLIAALVVSAAYDLLSRQRLTIATLLIGVASFMSVVLTWSASSVLTMAMTIGAVLLVALTRAGLRGAKPFLLLVLYAALNIGIVVFQVQERVSGFITNVLDRSADLTGRTRIWEIVFDMIRESPLIGHGVQRSENNGLTIYNPHFVHAHNGELDILMQGGLLAFIPFVIMIIITTRNASHYYSNRAVQILYIGLILVMLRAITGLFFSPYAVLLVFLLLNSQTIARIYNETSSPQV
ncbi:O-antigen ligase family protein [Nesterenkonia sp. AY15]|uniref:O-antigen ligase family protein n=1 Tax=Nesterenkonia sp. AY15 TaxID=2901139 RepID=UPI001F4C58A4|nr:O-antigen ligase family protein [Nesterenkonia sp. AY15]MCH8571902.1 O-antigen ligase family protein [Nesterenkonia sp. AY15]